MYVYSFYKFIKLNDISILRSKIYKSLDKLNVKGTILISKEGINVNISQDKSLLDNALEKISTLIDVRDIFINKDVCNGIAFEKLKVKIKNEIIRFNSPFHNYSSSKLKRVDPSSWDKLLDEDIQLIDMRNDFEYSLGSFKDAINLKLINFTDLKERDGDLKRLDKKKKTAIFCTGGIRCEKAGKYLNDIGFDKVYQLKGGIINYLANGNKKDKWSGNCFVFDDRIFLKN
tara:strand:+ start:5279 stop:5968 length:690 start_codon:yes stop_codon:yes gene_type:complete